MRSFFGYWRRFFLQFGAECYHTWRAELLSTVAVAVVTYLLTDSSDAQAKVSLKTALLSVAIVLGCFALYHLIRAPWLMDAAKAKELADSTERLEKANALVEQLMSPADRPRLVFERWGPIPADHPVAIGTEIADGKGHVGMVFLQNGFHFINDGAPAYEVMVEKFSVGQVEAHSGLVPRIGKEGGFALIWIAQAAPLQSSRSSAMWDLQHTMASADEERGISIYGADFSVPVSVTYRGDNTNVWYRSKAMLTYIRSQGRLEFGAITHESGFLTRPS